MLNIEELVSRVLSGDTPQEVILELKTRAVKRRFRPKGKGYNPVTGKRVDPRRSMVAKRSFARSRAAHKMGQKKYQVSGRAKQMAKSRGRLVARIRRR